MTATATGQKLISADTLGNLYSAIDAKYGDTFFSAIALVDAGILDRAKWDTAKGKPGFDPVAFMNDDSNWTQTAYLSAHNSTNADGEMLAAFKASDDWKTSTLDIVLAQNAKHLQGELSAAGLDVTFGSLDPAVQQQLLFIATTKGARGAAKWLAGEQAKAPAAFDAAATVQGEIARLSARGRSVASDAPTLASVLGADAAPGTLAAKGGPNGTDLSTYHAPVLTPGTIPTPVDDATFNPYAIDPEPASTAQELVLGTEPTAPGDAANFVAKGGKTPAERITAAQTAIDKAFGRVETAEEKIEDRTETLANSADPDALVNNESNTETADQAVSDAYNAFDKLAADIQKAEAITDADKKAEAYEALAVRAEAIAKAVEDADAAYGTDIADTQKDQDASRIGAVGVLDYAGTEGSPEAARKLGQNGQLVGRDPMGKKMLNQQVFSNQLEVIREQIRAIGAQLAAGMPVNKDMLTPWKDALNRMSGLITVPAWQQTFTQADRGFLNGKKGLVQGLQNDIAAYEKDIEAKAAKADAEKKDTPTAIAAGDLALSPTDKAALIASMRDELDPKVTGKGVKRFSDDRIPEAFIDKLLSEKDPATVAIRDSIFDRVRNAFAAKNKKLTGPEVNGRKTPSKQDIIDYATGKGRKLRETSLADDYIAYLEPKVRDAVKDDVYAIKDDKVEADKKDAFIAANNAAYQAAFVEAMKSAYANAEPTNGAATAFAAKKPKGDPAPAPQDPNPKPKPNTQTPPAGPIVQNGRATVDQVFSPATDARPDIVIDMSENPMLFDTLPDLFQDVRPEALPNVATR